MIEKVNLAEKLNSFDEHWVPKIVGELNGQYVKVAKFQGEYVWHRHTNEDELFLVINGRIRIPFRDLLVSLERDVISIVPRRIAHKPVAEGAAAVLLLEPADTSDMVGTAHVYNNQAGDTVRI